ncbi:MAG: diacylglycerol kinase family protein [Patescibacteria group bacterium]
MMHKHRISVQNAWNGLVWALKTQPNYRIHLFLAFCAVIGGIIFRITYEEFLVIAVLITIGLSVETINTALEAATDAIDTSWREDIKIAKDVSAGAMLIFALGAFFISCIIFLPKIVAVFGL